MHLLPLADVTVVPSIFPEAFGMVAAEAAAAGSPPLVARHSGLAEVAAGLEEEYPERFRHLASFETGDAARPRAQARASSSRCRAADHDAAAARGAAGGRRPLVVGERRRAPARSRSDGRTATLCADGRRTTRLLAGAARASRARRSTPAPTSPLAVEEEFALLDPETLELTDRFEEL